MEPLNWIDNFKKLIFKFQILLEQISIQKSKSILKLIDTNYELIWKLNANYI